MIYPYVQDCIPQEDCTQVNNPLVILGAHSGKSVTVTLTSSRTDLSQRSEPILGNMCPTAKQEYFEYYSYTVDGCALINVIVGSDSCLVTSGVQNVNVQLVLAL